WWEGRSPRATLHPEKGGPTDQVCCGGVSPAPRGAEAGSEGNGSQAEAEATGQGAQPLPVPTVMLPKASEQPTVCGQTKSRLTFARYNIVKTLVMAGQAGLTGDELVKKSGHSGAVNTLKALARSDAEWGRAIQLPGVPGGRYRIPYGRLTDADGH